MARNASGRGERQRRFCDRSAIPRDRDRDSADGYDGNPVLAMSAAAPPIAAPVPPPAADPPSDDMVAPVNAPNVVTFFATLWAVLAVAFGLFHYASTLLGAPPIYPMEYPFNA